MKSLLLPALAVCLVCNACQRAAPRLNAPPHGLPEQSSELQDTYLYMVDNGLLEDMTISDIHFTPHRPALNTLGEERLCRLAGLLEVYGGVVRFNTSIPDVNLVQQRTDAIRAFLNEQGVDTTTEVLTRDLPGGRGMDAKQAILIKARDMEAKSGPDSAASPISSTQSPNSANK